MMHTMIFGERTGALQRFDEARRTTVAVMLGILAMLCSSAAAASTAGTVQFASGSASVTRANGAVQPLRTGGEVLSGDLVDTGTGRVQLRFSDGALVSLQPESQFRIDDYRFDGKTDGSEKGFFSLLKGGLRTISGWIGRVHRDGYHVDTPTATIGIRGTEYTAVLGHSLTVSVGEGRVVITNDAGEFFLDAGRSVYVKDRKTLPVITSEKPFLPPSGAQPALASFQDPPFTAGDNLQGELLTLLQTVVESGASLAPGTLPQFAPPNSTPPVIGGGTLPPVTTPPGGGTTPPGGGTSPPGGGSVGGDYVVMAGAAELQTTKLNGALLDAGPATALKCSTAGDCTQLGTASFKLNQGSASTVENGFDGVIGWGRWTAGKYNNTSTQYGNTTLLDFEGLNYVYGAVTAQLPKTDLKGNTVGTYSVAGAPSATSVGGALGLGVFTGAVTNSRLLRGQPAPAGTAMVVDFTNAAVELGFNVAFKSAGVAYNTTTSAPVTITGTSFALNGAQLNTTGCVSSACGTQVQGFFAGPNAERVGLGYQIEDRVTVHGTAALKQN